MTTTIMTIEEIREYLPQRYPFLLIDRVLELDLSQSITACKNVSVNEPFFDGHFPGTPIMPGVLIIEAMTQAAGILGFKSIDKKPVDGSVYLFAGADKVRFKRQVVPGDQLILKARYVAHRRNIWRFDCSAYVDGQLVATADVLCADKAL